MQDRVCSRTGYRGLFAGACVRGAIGDGVLNCRLLSHLEVALLEMLSWKPGQRTTFLRGLCMDVWVTGERVRYLLLRPAWNLTSPQ